MPEIRENFLHRLRQQGALSLASRSSGELKDLPLLLARFRARLLLSALAVLLCALTLAGRLFWLQVVQHRALALQSDLNRVAVVPITPRRGVITDRNGAVLADEEPVLTLEAQAGDVAHPRELFAQLRAWVDLSEGNERRFVRQRASAKGFEMLALKSHLSAEEAARFAARRFLFPQLQLLARPYRRYPYGETASHVLGHMGRISAAEVERLEQSEQASNYLGTAFIGKQGIESRYETLLHGQTGFDKVEATAHGNFVRQIETQGAEAGSDLVLTLDLDLQRLAESLFGERRGALVAIEPSSGEVLALLSHPNFNPNLFVDGIDSEDWAALTQSPDKPMLNRAISGTYPPASTYKPYLALAALQQGIRRPEQLIRDPGYFLLGGNYFRDTKRGGRGWVAMQQSIVESSDTYYYALAHEMGAEVIAAFTKQFGFGQILGLDLDGEVAGILPTPEWKSRAVKNPREREWRAGDTVSLGVGQGYNSFTILQLAHAVATLANDGRRLRPHLLREARASSVNGKPQTIDAMGGGAAQVPTGNYDAGRVVLSPEALAFVRQAMVGVTRSPKGTAAGAFVGAPYETAAKTGTAQVFTIGQGKRYEAGRVDDRLRDHSLFIAYAPASAPRIALAMVAENAGWGASVAAPIARKLLDFYLLGKGGEMGKTGAVADSAAASSTKTNRVKTLADARAAMGARASE